MGYVAVVTGASRGLGLATARALSRPPHSYSVFQCTRTAVAPAAADSLLRPLSLTTTDKTSISAAAQTLRAHTDGIDLLINNAGTNNPSARTNIDTNFHGTRNVTDALLPLMKPGGMIINVSGLVAPMAMKQMSESIRNEFLREDLTVDELAALVEKYMGSPKPRAEGWPASSYFLSKAAVNMLTRIYARDHPHIRINAVCPGHLRTDMGGAKAPLSVEQGVERVIALATGTDVGTGKYYAELREQKWV